MRIATQVTTRSPLVRQPPRDDGFHRSIRTGERPCPLICSSGEQRPRGGYRASVRGKRTADYPLRIIARNLIRETLVIRAGCSAEAPEVGGQRINPMIMQGIYEFQLAEFLERVERTQCTDGCH
jgi:hypothetical protein